jgi:hypothetical protein
MRSRREGADSLGKLGTGSSLALGMTEAFFVMTEAFFGMTGRFLLDGNPS